MAGQAKGKKIRNVEEALKRMKSTGLTLTKKINAKIVQRLPQPLSL